MSRDDALNSLLNMEIISRDYFEALHPRLSILIAWTREQASSVWHDKSWETSTLPLLPQVAVGLLSFAVEEGEQ